MKNPNINLSKLNPAIISQESSPRHIQSVLEDLIEIAEAGQTLANSTVTLNPYAGEIGEGRVKVIIEKAQNVISKLDKETLSAEDAQAHYEQSIFYRG